MTRTTESLALGLLTVLMACGSVPPRSEPATSVPAAQQLSPTIAAQRAKLPATRLDYDRALLDANETQVLQKLIEAARIIDDLHATQVTDDYATIRASLERAAATSPAHQEALAWYVMNRGRWDRLAADAPFVEPFGDAGKKPVGATFYPRDLTKDAFERWLAAHPGDNDAFQHPCTVIRRDGARLKAVPYAEVYQPFLDQAAVELREAAALTKNASLKRYLELRAAAFSSNDYFDSDVAWMELDAPIEVVLGPYEVYEDGLLNLKGAFQAFGGVVDKGESDKLAIYQERLAELERNLPIPDQHKNPKRGALPPIRVVHEVFTAGDARTPIVPSAFNLPNDERVREAKGSKTVLIKDMMEAKYKLAARPIGLRIRDPSQTSLLSFDAAFNATLFHELAHGLGPGMITGPDGKRVEHRLLLKELSSSIEESKADVVGTWSLLYAIDNKLVTAHSAEQVLVTDVAVQFRMMRFGIDESHGQGSALQWKRHRENGGIVPGADGTFKVDMEKMRDAVTSLATELLMIEATGDYARAKALLEKYGVTNAEVDGIVAKLADLPVDLTPVFAAAGEG